MCPLDQTDLRERHVRSENSRELCVREAQALGPSPTSYQYGGYISYPPEFYKPLGCSLKMCCCFLSPRRDMSTENLEKTGRFKMIEELCLLCPNFISATFVGSLLSTQNWDLPTSLTVRMLNHGLLKIDFQGITAGSYLCWGWQCGM